jgi:periplasmic copper chaperone A
LCLPPPFLLQFLHPYISIKIKVNLLKVKIMFKKITLSLSVALVMTGSVWAHEDAAHVNVDGAWIRATVAGQMGTGGFMKLTAREDLRLVRVSSPAAEVAEIHEMKMGANNVMEMRPIAGLDLPKGKIVELKPGSYHLMLMSLKQALPKDSTVPVTLFFKDAKGAESKLNLKVPVSLAPMQASPDQASQPMHKH